MNLGHLLIHNVTVSRPSLAMATGTKQPIRNADTSVISNMPCRVSPIPYRQQQSILGRFPQAQWKLYWETTVLKDEDIVSYDAKTYILRDVQKHFAEDGITEHHYEAILEEKK